MAAKKTNQLMLLLFSLLFLLNSCEKVNEQTGIYFLQNEWIVQSVTNEGKRFRTPSDKIFRENAYILKFVGDSIFEMHTSVNYAGGNYQIVSERHIIISHYGEWTEVYNSLEHQRNFDEQLVSIFNGKMSYSYKKNKLIFRNEQNQEIVFAMHKY